jgi:hypothetical protein
MRRVPAMRREYAVMRREYASSLDLCAAVALLQFQHRAGAAASHITIRLLRRNERTMATTMAAEAVEMTARIARKPKSNPSMITYAHDSRRIVDTVALRMMARRGEDTY